MVIACQKCGTRFHLDDTRIPKKGVRVRCSRCKHAFFVRPPGATNDDTLNGIAADAAARPRAAPEPSADLPDPERTAIGFDVPSEEEESDWEFNDDLGGDLFDGAPASAEPARAPAAGMPEPAAAGELDPNAVTQAPGALGEREEADSSFDFSGFENAASDGPDLEADPVGSNATEVLEPEAQAPAAAAPPAAAAMSAASEPSADHTDTAALEDLGSPEDWDLLGEVEEPSASASEPAPPRDAPQPVLREAPAMPPAAAEETAAVEGAAPASQPAAPRTSRSPLVRAPVATASSPAQAPAQAEAAPRATRRASVDVSRLDTVGRALAYALVGVLFAVGLLRTVAVAPSPGTVAIPPSATAGSLRVDDLVARTLENAVAGPVYVVTGTLHPAAGHRPGEWLRVSLTDRAGEVLPGGMLVGAGEPVGMLREADPRAIREGAEGAVPFLAWGPLPAAGLAFHAVFESVPAAAAGLAFSSAPVAAPPPEPVEPEGSDPATAAPRPELPSSPRE